MNDEPKLPHPDERKPPVKLPEEIILRYRPLIEIEKWLAQRVDDRTERKTLYVSGVAVVFCLFAVPLVLFALQFLVSWINGLSGAAAMSGMAAQLGNQFLLFGAFLTVSTIGLAAAAGY